MPKTKKGGQNLFHKNMAKVIYKKKKDKKDVNQSYRDELKDNINLQAENARDPVISKFLLGKHNLPRGFQHPEGHNQAALKALMKFNPLALPDNIPLVNDYPARDILKKTKYDKVASLLKSTIKANPEAASYLGVKVNPEHKKQLDTVQAYLNGYLQSVNEALQKVPLYGFDNDHNYSKKNKTEAYNF